MSNDGATPPSPHEQKEQEAMRAECMGRWKHNRVAVWEGGEWTDKTRCTTCGTVFDKNYREIPQ